MSVRGHVHTPATTSYAHEHVLTWPAAAGQVSDVVQKHRKSMMLQSTSMATGVLPPGERTLSEQRAMDALQERLIRELHDDASKAVQAKGE